MKSRQKEGKAIFTARHLQRYLKAQWKGCGISLMRSQRMGLSINELVRHSVKRNRSLDTPYVDLWVLILDEFISWEISLFTVIYAGRTASLSNFDRAMISSWAKVIADSIAIRHLILAGYDTQAKILLRSTGEYLELIVAILDDPSLADEFVQTDLPEDSAAFWSKHLAKGEVRKKIKRAWSNFLVGHEDAAKWFSNWGHTWVKSLSSLSHPSIMGGWFSVIPLKEKYDDEKWLGLFGDKSNGSVETVMNYAAYLFPVLLLGSDYPFAGFEKNMGASIEYDEKEEVHKHVKLGRSVLGSLILSLGSEPNGRYVFPEHDLSIFSSRR